jgi:hypothetical protein
MATKTKAAVAVSQNGWRGLPTRSPLLHTWVIPGQSGTTKIRLRNGSAGFLLAHLALWFDDLVEDLTEPVLDDWGYAYRPVRGYVNNLSNHASGTAIDLNATDHPLGKVGTFTTAETRAIRRRLAFYGGAIKWGDYRGRRDEMHFEINAPLQAVEHQARRLLDSPRGARLLKHNPGQRAVVLS